jgi:glycosyl hydrolase family 59 (putative galactocerebrosidase)
MHRRRLLLAAACAASATSVAAQQQTSVALGRAQPGQLPEGFRLARTGRGAPAAWSVVEDAGVPDGRVLAQTSTDQTDYRFPLAIYDGVTAKDLEVSVRFKAVAGRTDRAGGIAVRLTDADNYYVLRANALEDNVNFYRVLQGSRREIHGANAKVASDQWHSLTLKAVGDQFTIGFDGKTLFSVADQTFTSAGRIALWTKADSVTRFDNLAIRRLE